MYRLYFLYIFSFINVITFINVEAAVAILPPQDKPEKYAGIEGCYIPERDIVLPYNIPNSPKDGINCLQYLCGTDGYTSIYSCGAIGFDAPCRRVPGNKYLEYPKCCDSIFCPPTVKPIPKPSPCIVYPPPRDTLPVDLNQAGATKASVKCPPRPLPEPVIEEPVGPETTILAASTDDTTTSTVNNAPEVVIPRCPPGFGCVDPIFPGTSDS